MASGFNAAALPSTSSPPVEFSLVGYSGVGWLLIFEVISVCAAFCIAVEAICLKAYLGQCCRWGADVMVVV